MIDNYHHAPSHCDPLYCMILCLWVFYLCCWRIVQLNASTENFPSRVYTIKKWIKPTHVIIVSTLPSILSCLKLATGRADTLRWISETLSWCLILAFKISVVVFYEVAQNFVLLLPHLIPHPHLLFTILQYTHVQQIKWQKHGMFLKSSIQTKLYSRKTLYIYIFIIKELNLVIIAKPKKQ